MNDEGKENSIRSGHKPTIVHRGRFIAAAALLVLVPALIPLYFAVGQEPGGLKIALFALSAGLLVVNAGLLYVMYRWLQTTTQGASATDGPSAKTDDHGSKEDFQD